MHATPPDTTLTRTVAFLTKPPSGRAIGFHRDDVLNCGGVGKTADRAVTTPADDGHHAVHLCFPSSCSKEHPHVPQGRHRNLHPACPRRATQRPEHGRRNA